MGGGAESVRGAGIAGLDAAQPPPRGRGLYSRAVDTIYILLAIATPAVDGGSRDAVTFGYIYR